MLEFAVTILIGFRFLARRYGVWIGLVMAGSLLLMPRIYGQAHLIDTDTPGLLLWAATSLAFWKGLYEARGRRWRMAVGILVGLAFIEKLGAVVVLVPLVLWMIAGHLLRTAGRPGAKYDWIDGLLTTGAMLAPLSLAFEQIEILQQRLPPPMPTDLFVDRPASDWSGAIWPFPWAYGCSGDCSDDCFRRAGCGAPSGRHSRPGQLSWPLLQSWLGSATRHGGETLPDWPTITPSATSGAALPDIQIIYFGQVYEYSLPWHNAWVLMGITVPVAILGAAAIGLCWAGTDPEGQAAVLLPDPPDDVAGHSHVRYAST